MVKPFPLNPPHPERLCWGCDLYCPANAMRCGNGSERTQHPHELFGDDWAEWGGEHPSLPAQPAGSPTRVILLHPSL